jgi:hypothetical protein
LFVGEGAPHGHAAPLFRSIERPTRKAAPQKMNPHFAPHTIITFWPKGKNVPEIEHSAQILDAEDRLLPDGKIETLYNIRMIHPENGERIHAPLKHLGRYMVYLPSPFTAHFPSMKELRETASSATHPQADDFEIWWLAYNGPKDRVFIHSYKTLLADEDESIGWEIEALNGTQTNSHLEQMINRKKLQHLAAIQEKIGRYQDLLA